MPQEPLYDSTIEPPSSRGNGKLKAEEVTEQLNRILQSAAFQRSERLQRFLKFVCESTLRGESGQLHEYLIGSEVFGRGPEYSPHEDGIVRRQAHTLRRKLHEYYEGDGAQDLIRIDLPVGRYVPTFRRIETAAPEVAVETPAPQPGQVPPAPPIPNRRWWPMIAIGGLTLFGLGWMGGTLAKPKAAAPGSSLLPAEVTEIWGAWLNHPNGAVVCFSNPLTAVVKHYPQPLAPDSQPARMRLTPEQEKFFRSVVSLPSGGYLYFAPAISQTKMGESFAAVRLANLFTSAGRDFRATQSRFVSWEDLKRQNMILLGHNEANKWVDRILKPYPFQLSMTQSDKQRAIVNTRAGKGEKNDYQIQYADEDLTGTEEYALISMLPGVDAQHLILLING